VHRRELLAWDEASSQYRIVGIGTRGELRTCGAPRENLTRWKTASCVLSPHHRKRKQKMKKDKQDTVFMLLLAAVIIHPWWWWERKKEINWVGFLSILSRESKKYIQRDTTAKKGVLHSVLLQRSSTHGDNDDDSEQEKIRQDSFFLLPIKQKICTGWSKRHYTDEYLRHILIEWSDFVPQTKECWQIICMRNTITKTVLK
jgi:hypothetical protein